MEFATAFITGGILCAAGQLLIDLTKLTPARILTVYVVAGTVLTVLGVYEPIVEFGGAGATVPLSGFGYTLGKGVMKAVEESGFAGAFSGGVTAASAGIAAAVFFGLLFALIFKSRAK